jgi:16S rRNA (guanine527-N7)-methyltransferase
VQYEKKIWFRNLCAQNGFVLTELQLEQFDQYVNLLLGWNKKINLLSRKDEENVWTYHILHCISPLFKISILDGSKIVDIGTGGGLPGVPLRILRPDLSLLCLDATRKKANAVSQMVSDLKLEGINVLWGRAEEICNQPEYLNKFDFAIARAVGPLNELVAWSKNFLRKRNQNTSDADVIKDSIKTLSPPALIAFKGGDLTQEIEVAKRQYSHLNIKTVELAFTGSEQLMTSDKKILIIYL